MILDRFAQACYINLDERPDRLARVQSQLAAVGLLDAFERVRGITVTDREGFYKRGARGNWLSHVHVWTRALERGGAVLIAEDDVEFSPDFRERFAACVADLPDDWDFFYAQGWEPAGEMQHPPGLHRIPSTLLTHFYGVSARMLPRLVEMSADNPGKAIDAWLSTRVHPTSTVYCAFPALASQNGIDSELQHETYEGRYAVTPEGRLEGWARNLDDWRRPVVVEVLRGATPITTLEATEPRPQLRGNRNCGFSLALAPGAGREVEVRIAGTTLFLVPEGSGGTPDAVSRPAVAAGGST